MFCGSRYKSPTENFHPFLYSHLLYPLAHVWPHHFCCTSTSAQRFYRCIKLLVCLWISLPCPLGAVPFVKHGLRSVLEDMHVHVFMYIQGCVCLRQFAAMVTCLFLHFQLHLIHFHKNEYLNHEPSFIKVYICRL